MRVIKVQGHFFPLLFEDFLSFIFLSPSDDYLKCLLFPFFISKAYL